jgi:hypothetical protein
MRKEVRDALDAERRFRIVNYINGRVHIGLEVFHNLCRTGRGMQEFTARVALDLGLPPCWPEVQVLDYAGAGPLFTVRDLRYSREGCALVLGTFPMPPEG